MGKLLITRRQLLGNLAVPARAFAIDKGIHYAFVGNVPGHPGNHTYCPKCGKIVIKREGFFVEEMHLAQGRCAFCQQPIAGVWA
jgi:pyruvate formate lyase activating enzyme